MWLLYFTKLSQSNYYFSFWTFFFFLSLPTLNKIFTAPGCLEKGSFQAFDLELGLTLKSAGYDIA